MSRCEGNSLAKILFFARLVVRAGRISCRCLQGNSVKQDRFDAAAKVAVRRETACSRETPEDERNTTPGDDCCEMEARQRDARLDYFVARMSTRLFEIGDSNVRRSCCCCCRILNKWEQLRDSKLTLLQCIAA